MRENGFKRHTVAEHTHLVADLSGWLSKQGLPAAEFTVDEVPVFLADRRMTGNSVLVSARGLVPLMQFLRERGVIPAPSGPTAIRPADQLVEQYGRYLQQDKGLAPLSILRYRTTGLLFLSTLPDPLPTSLRDLSATQVHQFVLDEVTHRGTWSAKSLVTALRSLLRFLHISGRAPAGLAMSVPSVAGWGLRSLPRGISGDLLTAMLAGCDRQTPMGRRGFAILLMLSRMGLRNGEVCRLGLDDIDWRSGEILIHGKGCATNAGGVVV